MTICWVRRRPLLHSSGMSNLSERDVSIERAQPWRENRDGFAHVRAQFFQSVRRKRGPTIAWEPTHDPYHHVAGILGNASRTPSVHITQRAIRAIGKAIRHSSTALPFGVLTGQLYVCPDTGVEYLLIDDVFAAQAELTASDLPQQLATELRSLSSLALRRGKMPVGWYVSGVGDDLQLGGEDLAVHREVFPEPWQVVLVHDDSRGVQKAAFLRFEPTTDRSYAIPFFEELTEAPRGAGKAEQRSAVSWTNYRSDQETIRPDESPAALGLTVEGPPSRQVSRIRTWFEFFRRSPRSVEPEPSAGERGFAPTLAEPVVPPQEHSVSPTQPEVKSAEATTTPAIDQAATSAAAQQQQQQQLAKLKAHTAATSATGRFVFIAGELVGFSEQPDEKPRVSRTRIISLVVAGSLALAAIVGAYMISR